MKRIISIPDGKTIWAKEVVSKLLDGNHAKIKGET
jgi:hypothetical protein